MLLQFLSCIMHGQEQGFRIPRPHAALLMAKTPTSGAGAGSCKGSHGNAAKCCPFGCHSQEYATACENS